MNTDNKEQQTIYTDKAGMSFNLPVLGSFFVDKGRRVEVIACKKCGGLCPKWYQWTDTCFKCSFPDKDEHRERRMARQNDYAWNYGDTFDSDSGL